VNVLSDYDIQCPYCGETITVMIDCSAPRQAYIEDCQVCCQPINFVVTVAGDEDVDVIVSTDSD